MIEGEKLVGIQKVKCEQKQLKERQMTDGIGLEEIDLINFN